MIKQVVMTATSIVMISGLTMGLTACSPGHNTVGSTIAGAAAGGILGGAIFGGSGLAIAGSALAGGVIGNLVGQHMDRSDRERAAAAYASDSGRAKWQSRQGYIYTVEPVRKFTRNGRHCRRYKTTVQIKSRFKTAYGIACRDRHGRWRVG